MTISDEGYIVNCPNCDAPMYSIACTNEVDPIQNWGCSKCGDTYTVLIDEFDFPSDPYYDGRFVVKISWRNTLPTVQEIKHIRSLLPFYGEMPIIDIKNQFQGRTNLEITDLEYGVAVSLVEQAKKLGFETVMEQL